MKISSKFVIELKHIYKEKQERIGAKALNLSKLMRVNFLVPQGFYITPQTYLYFIHTNRLKTNINSLIAKVNLLEKENMESITSNLFEIQERIKNGIYSRAIKENIFDFYKRLNNGFVAVRSCATIEDTSADSFAGQYDSYLNVEGEEEVLEAIKKCWASLWSKRAVFYLKMKGRKLSNKIGMGVLIQEMVPAESSGVIFTYNPVTFEKNEILINANWGLGETTVAGKITPDQYIINKYPLKLKEKQINPKYVTVTTNSHKKGVIEIPLPKKVVDKQTLADNKIIELARIGLEIEKEFNQPQDIEWALYQGKFYILQSRAIVSPNSKNSKDNSTVETIWSNINLGEVLPGVITPYSWSIYEKALQKGFEERICSLGIRFDGSKLVRLIYGRPYLNISSFFHHFAKIPWLPLKLFKNLCVQVLGGDKEIPFPNKSGNLFNLLLLFRIIPSSLKVFFKTSRLPKSCQDFIPYLISQIGEKKKIDLKDLSKEELAVLYEQIYCVFYQCFELSNLASGVSFLYYGILTEIVNKWGDRSWTNIQNDLITGFSDMKSAQFNIDLWKLSVVAKESSLISDVFLNEEIERIKERMTSFKEGRKFWQEFEGFLVQNGHRCFKETELMMPRWEEDYRFVISMIKNYIISTPQITPLRFVEEQRRKQNDTFRMMDRKLFERLRDKIFPFKKWCFYLILKETQKYVLLRENMRFYIPLSIYLFRKIAIEIGRRLFEDKIISTVDDVFFLSADKVIVAIMGKINSEEIRWLINDGKEEYRKNLTISPPNIIVEGKEIDKEETISISKTESILRGIGSSSGIGSGKAKVIIEIKESLELKGDEILVVPSTDPSWTPLFLTVKGIIMERGGLLSHGAIVAREYGIPTVVNVKDATKIIKDGQQITIDGSNGIIYLF